MAIQWFNGIIHKIIELNTTTRSFFIEVEDVEIFDFEPGQFITLDLPIGEKRAQRWRSYSIASSPSGTNIVELCIVKNANGLGTPYLFNLKEGDSIKFKGPDGGFVLPKDLTKELILICTGTGVAPFKSMIDHVISQNIDFTSIHLIFGTRFSEGILFREHFNSLANQHSNFSYSVALSRESAPGTSFGYVHDIYMDQYKNAEANKVFMLCGWTKMIDETVANLIVNCKYQPSQVKFELYG
jgi:NAD(P)H-flavin reductase